MIPRVGDSPLGQDLRGQGDRPVGLQRGDRVAVAVGVAEVAGHGQDAVVLQAVHEQVPRVGRVERVLGQGERARGGRGPRVDQRDLDEVVAVLLAGQVAARFVVDDVDLRLAVEVPREVAVDPVGQVDDVAVHLDAGDGVGVELERGQDVGAATDAHDEHVGIGADEVGEVLDLVAQAIALVGVAAPAGQQGPGRAVDDQAQRLAAGVVGVAVHDESGEGVPSLAGVVAVALLLRPDDAQDRGPVRVHDRVRGGEPAEDQDGDPRGGETAPAVAGGGEGERGGRGQGADHDHEAGTVDPGEEQDQHDAPHAGTDQVDGVEAVDLVREAGEGQAHHDAAEHERHGYDHARRHHGRHAGDGEQGGEGDGQLDGEADRDGDAEQQRVQPQLAPDTLVGEAAREQVDRQRAHRHAEQRHGDGDEGEVVPHRHAEDPREGDLQHERGQRHQEEAEVDAGAGARRR